MDDREVQERVARIEVLLEHVGDDPKAGEAIQAIVELYGEGLSRLLAGADPARDELLSHLLLIHDLHPTSVKTRILEALEEVRPYLDSHGGDVELLGVEDGVARVRLEGTCNGCPSSAVTLKLAIEEAVLKAAPELERIEAEGVAEPGPVPTALLPIASLQCPTELQSA